MNILFLLQSISGLLFIRIFKTKMLTTYFMFLLVSYISVCVFLRELIREFFFKKNWL